MYKVVLLVIIIIAVAHSKLQQVVSIFRHGARYAINSQYDGNQTYLYKGQLTAVGMRQHQTFGKTLRTQYIETYQFLSDHYVQGEIQVFSTSLNRTISSALSHLYGLYPLGKGQQLINVPRSYLIPPYSNQTDSSQATYALPGGHLTIPIKLDDSVLMSDCTNWDKLIIKNKSAQKAIYDEMELTYRPFYRRIAQIFNVTPQLMNIQKISDLYSTITVDKFLGRPLPSAFTQQDYVNMRHLHDWLNLFSIKFSLSKAINTPRFSKMLKEFDDRISNPKKLLKWTFLSAHDTDIIQIANDLNFSTDSCTEQLFRKGKTQALNCITGGFQYASNFIFQLHSNGQKSLYVKVKHEGKYMFLCERKQTSCPYAEWKERIKRILVDYTQICFKQMPNAQDIEEHS